MVALGVMDGVSHTVSRVPRGEFNGVIGISIPNFVYLKNAFSDLVRLSAFEVTVFKAFLYSLFLRNYV